MEDRIRAVMATTFGIELCELPPMASPQTVKAWDSLAHINLILALEQEFGVQFQDAEVPQLVSQSAIRSALKQRKLAALSGRTGDIAASCGATPGD